MGHVHLPVIPLQLIALYEELRNFDPRPNVSRQDLTEWDIDRMNAWVEAITFFRRPFSMEHLRNIGILVLQMLDSKVNHYNKLNTDIKYFEIYRIVVPEEWKRTLERVFLDITYCEVVFNLMQGLITHLERESMEFTFNF